MAHHQRIGNVPPTRLGPHLDTSFAPTRTAAPGADGTRVGFDDSRGRVDPAKGLR